MANEKKDGASDTEPLARRVRELERENRRLRERCEEAELESAELEKSLKSAEDTLSFRLGHALIQATKSVDGVRALPALLAELRRDARRRKKRDEPSLLGAAARTSLSRLGRLVRTVEGSGSAGDQKDDER
jgi:predicted RNase H-like nuclease (RuvC/YqgF family)